MLWLRRSWPAPWSIRASRWTSRKTQKKTGTPPISRKPKRNCKGVNSKCTGLTKIALLPKLTIKSSFWSWSRTATWTQFLNTFGSMTSRRPFARSKKIQNGQRCILLARMAIIGLLSFWSANRPQSTPATNCSRHRCTTPAKMAILKLFSCYFNKMDLNKKAAFQRIGTIAVARPCTMLSTPAKLKCSNYWRVTALNWWRCRTMRVALLSTTPSLWKIIRSWCAKSSLIWDRTWTHSTKTRGRPCTTLPKPARPESFPY